MKQHYIVRMYDDRLALVGPFLDGYSMKIWLGRDADVSTRTGFSLDDDPRWQSIELTSVQVGEPLRVFDPSHSTVDEQIKIWRNS